MSSLLFLFACSRILLYCSSSEAPLSWCSWSCRNEDWWWLNLGDLRSIEIIFVEDFVGNAKMWSLRFALMFLPKWVVSYSYLPVLEYCCIVVVLKPFIWSSWSLLWWRVMMNESLESFIDWNNFRGGLCRKCQNVEPLIFLDVLAYMSSLLLLFACSGILLYRSSSEAIVLIILIFVVMKSDDDWSWRS